MNEDNNTEPEKPEMPQEQTRKRSTSKTLAYLLLVVILLMGVGGMYVWQHSKVTSANSNISRLNDRTKQLKGQVSELQTKNKELQNTVSSYQSASDATQADLTFSVDGTTYEDHPYCQPITASPAFAAVDVVVSNPTHTSISLATSTLKLKDSLGNTYAALQNITSNSSCIGGYSALTNQTLAAGEKVKGALVFQVPNSSIHSFELVNGTKTYPVTIQ